MMPKRGEGGRFLPGGSKKRKRDAADGVTDGDAVAAPSEDGDVDVDVDVDVVADAYAMGIAGVLPYGGALATDALLKSFAPPALRTDVKADDVAALRRFDAMASLAVANIVRRYELRQAAFPTNAAVGQLCTIAHLVRMRVLQARHRPLSPLFSEQCLAMSNKIRAAIARVGSEHFPCPLAVSTVLWQLMRIARLVVLVRDARFTVTHNVRVKQPLADVLGWSPFAFPEAAAEPVTLREIAGLICRPARAAKAAFPAARNVDAFVRTEITEHVPSYLRFVGRTFDGDVDDVLGPVLDATPLLETTCVTVKQACDAHDVLSDRWGSSLDVLPHDIHDIVRDVLARVIYSSAQPAPCKDELLMQRIGDAVALQNFLLAMEYCVLTFRLMRASVPAVPL
jgi:hypothetical protein